MNRNISILNHGVDTPGAAVASTPMDADYRTVAASGANVLLGATGAIGDRLTRLIIVPATTSPGAVTIQDGGGAAITVLAGGATSVADLKPIVVELGLRATGAGWHVTTGANVSAIAVGNFT